MKKISYYVAAFALCCGVSQTLTSCIEETEEPDDVKALRQAEIAKINADAQKTLADAKESEANAAKTNADAAYREAETAIKAVEKAVKEGASAEEIQASIATYKATIQEKTNTMNSNGKTNATSFLLGKLNSDCPSYQNFVAAEKAYLGYDNSGSWEKGTLEKLADAIADTLDVYAVQDKAQTILDLQQAVLSDAKTVEAKRKDFDDWKKDYNDGSSVKAPDEYDMTDWSGTFSKSDDNAATLYNKGCKVWEYEIKTIEVTNKVNSDRLAKVQANAAATDSELWYSSDPTAPGKYNNYEAAVQDNDHAKANYEKYKAMYEEELAALKAINQ